MRITGLYSLVLEGRTFAVIDRKFRQSPKKKLRHYLTMEGVKMVAGEGHLFGTMPTDAYNRLLERVHKFPDVLLPVRIERRLGVYSAPTYEVDYYVVKREGKILLHHEPIKNQGEVAQVLVTLPCASELSTTAILRLRKLALLTG